MDSAPKDEGFKTESVALCYHQQAKQWMRQGQEGRGGAGQSHLSKTLDS